MAPQTDRRYGLPMNEVLDVLRELSVIYGIGAGYDLIDIRNGTFTVNSPGPISKIELHYHEDEKGKGIVDSAVIETKEFKMEWADCPAIFKDRLPENEKIRLELERRCPQYRFWLDFSKSVDDGLAGIKVLTETIMNAYYLVRDVEEDYKNVLDVLEW